MIALSFVELGVQDVQRAVVWYQEVLGLGVLMPPDANGFALLQTGSIQLALKEGMLGTGGVLLAFEVNDLNRWIERLRQQKVEMDAEVKTSAEGYRRLRLRDLDGYAVTLFDWLAKDNNDLDDGTSRSLRR